MCDMYDSFLRRLTAYRRESHRTQEEISAELGIDQSQLSKMELGKTIYSFKTLQNLYKAQWDMDYILIGKKYGCPESEFSLILEGAGHRYRKEALQLAAWALAQGIRKSKISLAGEAEFEIRLLNYRAYEMETRPLLYQIRVAAGMAQQAMSEKIGVNIKKYRMLERGELNPDAELLLRIYAGTGCRPSLFLEPGKIDQAIVDDLWELVKPPARAEMVLLLKQGISVLNS